MAKSHTVSGGKSEETEAVRESWRVVHLWKTHRFYQEIGAKRHTDSAS